MRIVHRKMKGVIIVSCCKSKPSCPITISLFGILVKYWLIRGSFDCLRIENKLEEVDNVAGIVATVNISILNRISLPHLYLSPRWLA